MLYNANKSDFNQALLTVFVPSRGMQLIDSYKVHLLLEPSIKHHGTKVIQNFAQKYLCGKWKQSYQFWYKSNYTMVRKSEFS